MNKITLESIDLDGDKPLTLEEINYLLFPELYEPTRVWVVEDADDRNIRK